MTAPMSDYTLLRDGGQVRIQAPMAEDRDAVAAFLQRLSAESRALRFHSAGIRTETVLDAALAGHALLAWRGDRLLALGSYAPLRDPARAEMALAVEDAEQGRGIGTALFERLTDDARRAGIRRFLAVTQATNTPMLALLGSLGFGTTRVRADSVVEVTIDLAPDPAYVARSDARRHVAAIASLAPLFRPRAIAVVGASRRAGTIGNAVLRNLLAGGFDGAVYPVNPAASSVASVRAYPSVAAIPEPVDLAVIVVPAHAVLAVATDCVESGVRVLVVISAGFAEAGAEGTRLQAALLDLCRRHGARLVGPNCLGVLSQGPWGVIDATFAPTLPPIGPVAISSQSGALGIAILEHAERLGLGIASFVSIGNKADLSSNDLLEYWEDDQATEVILLYLESFGNPRRFSRIARRVGARKPILAVKGGRSKAGQRAAASHTAALAGSDVGVDALFAQAGVIRCDTLEELFEATTLLANQPLPAGNRVGVLTNAGGLGILCADACEAAGLVLPELAAETKAALRAILPPEASIANPVDMLASGAAGTYGAALRLLLADPGIDAAIVLFIPPLVTQAAQVAAALLAACSPAPEKPVLACFVGAQGTPAALRGAATIPSFTFPESAARALGHAARRASWLRRAAGTLPRFAGIDREGARAIVEAALRREERPWLEAAEVQALLRAYDIAQPRGLIVHTPEAAANAYRDLGGGPVALKLVSRTILHKSDVGGVRLGVDSPEGAARAYAAIAASLDGHGLANALDGMLVQPMLSGGIECLIGVVTDPTFGPLIAFGSGGVTAEVFRDIAFRLHPLTDLDADELIAGVKVATLLRGYRGSPMADIPALRETLLRLSQLVDELPEVAEIDLNPVLVLPAGQGAIVLDARIRVQRAP